MNDSLSFLQIALRAATVAVVALLLTACGSDEAPPALDLEATSWSDIEARAEGTTVNMAMWTGDPAVNRYMRGYVDSTLQVGYGIDLTISSAQGPQIVSMLMTEQEAGRARSEFDLLWINGETFYQLRQIDALYGPFLDALPNRRLLDLDNRFINTDFQQPIDGYEAPWGNVQFMLITDTTRVPDPPRTRAELEAWVQEHPGRFTFDVTFAGMTFLKALLIDIAGGEEVLAGPFDEAAYERYSAQLWDYVRRLQPHLWKQGETFPQGVAQVHQLFATGEVDFTMSNNDGEVDNKVDQGLFPETARAYVPDFGSIQNSHYLGIPARSVDKAAALVAINVLISPEAQARKLRPTVWGDGTVLDRDALPAPWPSRFAEAAAREHAPSRASIQDRALAELAPEYMIRLYDDFRREIIER